MQSEDCKGVELIVDRGVAAHWREWSLWLLLPLEDDAFSAVAGERWRDSVGHEWTLLQSKQHHARTILIAKHGFVK